MAIKNIFRNPFALLLGCMLISCESEIFPKLEQAESILVVDAWLNNKPEEQTIILSETQPYFENSLPTGVLGAQIEVVDDQGKIYPFVERDGTNGVYTMVSFGSEVFGEVGRSFELTIQLNGDLFKAVSFMKRVPTIDSLTFTFEEKNSFQEDAYIAEFWATDPKGPNDNYWIKAYKNGVLLNKPGEINLAYDAGFSAGGNFDGVTFITPIRQGINPFELGDDNIALSPYLPNDSVYVEIHSITLPAFNFMNEVVIQTNRPGGFSELFATPLSNVSTNIANVTGTKKVVGFFCTSAVSSSGKRLKK